jgi:hypothetical protein
VPKRVVMLCLMLAFTMRGGERLPANDLFWGRPRAGAHAGVAA